jgi:UDP-N-acetylmuramoyl-L-alanyl-D-glutamate--2,6-diaminopimelate ligase
LAALKDILYKVALDTVSGDMNAEVTMVRFDSRAIAPGDLFVAIKGSSHDGHQYIEQAIKNGAVAVICEELPHTLQRDVTYIKTPDTAKALGVIATNFYGNPSEKLKVVAVTGTNGKTTTVSLLFELFRALGYNVGLLSTVTNKINEQELKATHTTPDAMQINALMAQMVRQSCEFCFMEASSHAIVQERMKGIRFSGAVFTNITHDHLDYHRTFDAYIAAKKKLFDELPVSSFALFNADDKRGNVMVQNCKAEKRSFALKTLADFKGRVISNTLQGLEMNINQRDAWFRLIGEFNAYNLLAVYAVAMQLGEDEEEVLMHLSQLGAAPGRFQQVPNESGITALVDYAHTPDALQNVLETIHQFRTGNEQLITVVGCGGNRDAGKRPLMAEIATRLSDRVILTSDNPRDEDPEAILDEMQKGVSPSNYKKILRITDRKEAIRSAAAFAQAGDIILLAGKGHETYQEIKGVKHDFDDRIVLAEMIKTIHT